MSPRRGTRRFRRYARIKLRGGTLTVTDRQRRSTSVSIGPDPESPQELATYFPDQGKGRLEMALIDGTGHSLFVADAGAWDSMDLQDLIDAAGFKEAVWWYPEEPPPLRPDGRILRDSEWWK